MASNPYPQKMIPATIAAIEVKTIMKVRLRVVDIVMRAAMAMKQTTVMRTGKNTKFLCN